MYVITLLHSGKNGKLTPVIY